MIRAIFICVVLKMAGNNCCLIKHFITKPVFNSHKPRYTDFENYQTTSTIHISHITYS